MARTDESRAATPTATLGDHLLSAHDHVCVFHRGREERDRLVLPFLAEGLTAGQPGMYLAPDAELADIEAQLGGQGDLELSGPEGGHLRGGRFEPEELLESLDDWACRKLTGDDHALGRIVGDMSWAERLMSPQLVAKLVAEEVAVTEWAPRHPQIALCLYDLDIFGGDLIIPMLCAHPKVWMAGAILDNPYHLTRNGDGRHDTRRAERSSRD